MNSKTAKATTYPVGSLVKIVKHKSRPPNWNTEMMMMAGQIHTVRSTGPPSSSGSYRYRLEGFRWSFRHIDFELVQLPKPEPNRAFRIKKNGH